MQQLGQAHQPNTRKAILSKEMRSDRYQEDIEELNEVEEESRKRFGRKRKDSKSADEQDEPDISKLKKHEILGIMLAQSKEIDRLRERVSELEAQLEVREFEFSKIGSIAEASLAVTNIFKEAEKAAVIYIENIRRRCEEEE